MKLEGKSLEMFEAWFSGPLMCCNGFNNLSNSMKYGVYVDFFDSVGVTIQITEEFDFMGNYQRGFNPLVDGKQYYFNNDCFETRPKARQQAISKAMEIYNNRK